MDGSIREILHRDWKEKAAELLDLEKQKQSTNKPYQVPISNWEWQKNLALLELTHQNEDLRRVLNEANVATLEWEAKAHHNKSLLQKSLETQEETCGLLHKAQVDQQLLLKRTAVILVFKQLVGVLSKWRLYCKLHKKKQVLLKREHIWNLSVLAKWFDSWLHMYDLCRVHKRLLRRFMMLRRRRILFACICGWRNRINAEKDLQRKSKLLVKLKNRQTSSFINTFWRTSCSKKLYQKAQERRAKRVWIKHQLQNVWSRWQSCAETSMNNKVIAEVLYKKKGLQECWIQWKRFTMKNVRKSASFADGNRHRALFLVGMSFRGWLQYSQQKSLVAERSRFFISRSVFRLQRRFLATWLKATMRHKEKRTFRLSLKQKKERQMKVTVFSKFWALRARTRLLDKFKLHQVPKKRKSIFNAWCTQLIYNQWCTSWMHSKERLAEFQSLKRAFFAWLLHTEMCRTEAVSKELHMLAQKIKEVELDLRESQRLKMDIDKLEFSIKVNYDDVANQYRKIMENMPPLLETRLQWLPVTSEIKPSPRAGHSAVSISSRIDSRTLSYIAVFGGYNGQAALGDILLFDTAQKEWRNPVVSAEEGSAYPRAVWNHTACICENRMIIFGGVDGCMESSELSILSFSESAESCSWSQPRLMMGASPSPLSQHTSCLYQGQYMVVFGGYRAASGHLNELWILDLHLMAWTSPDCFGTPPTPRRGHSATIVGNWMYVFGGYNGFIHFSDVHRLDLQSYAWECTSTQGDKPSPRRHHAMAAVGEHLVVYGGYNGQSYLDDFFSLNTETNTWRCWNVVKPRVHFSDAIQGGPVFQRSLHTISFVDKQQLVVFGGLYEKGSLQDIMFLQNVAVLQGYHLKILLVEEAMKNNYLQRRVKGCKELLETRSKELISTLNRASYLEQAYKKVQDDRKVLTSKNATLRRKLEKARQHEKVAKLVDF